METEPEWVSPRDSRGWDLKDAAMGLLRFVLLFGLCVGTLSLIALPALHKNQMETNDHAVDPIAVGSTSRNGGYTIQNGVIPSSPNSVCIVRPNGTRSGDC